MALRVGVFMWSGPAEFSGAEVGNAMECHAGICQVIDIDESLFEDDVEFSDLPQTILFEGTEAEVNAWTDEQHLAATRPIAFAWIGGAVVLFVIALFGGRRAKASPQS